MDTKRLSTGFIVIALMLTTLFLPVESAGVQPYIGAGNSHSIAVKDDGTVWAWGMNILNQLGDGTTTDRWTPVQVLGPGGAGFLTGAKAVAGGENNTVVLKDDGTVWAWGYNLYGQLGDNTGENRTTPVQVLGPGGVGFFTGVKTIEAGQFHTVALKDGGTVWAWGNNFCGQLGDNSGDSQETPVQVVGPGGAGFLTGVKAIAAGDKYTVALKDDGTVWAWGNNDYGQLGDNTTEERATPVQVNGPGGIGFLTEVKAIAAGSEHTVAVKSDGTVWAWGRNNCGQLGTGEVPGDTEDQTAPVQVIYPVGDEDFLTNVTAVAAAWRHTVALKNDGTVWAWGYNHQGQLGGGTEIDPGDHTWPVQVVGPEGTGSLTEIAAIAAGALHTLALKNNGSLWAWGYNYYGQVGDNTTENRKTPVQVLGPEGEGTLDLGNYVIYNYYLPYYVSSSGYWTGVGLKNGNKSFTASVTAMVYESTGTVLATESRSLDPRGQSAFMVGSGLNKEGWVKVASNEPLTGLGFVAMTGDDKLMFDMTLIPTLATTLHVPHVAQDATWDTIVYVCNPHDSETSMYLTFFNSEGTAVRVSHGFTLPANGSVSCTLSDLLGEDSYTSGSVEITASHEVAAFALYHNLKTGARSYAGITAVEP